MKTKLTTLVHDIEFKSDLVNPYHRPLLKLLWKLNVALSERNNLFLEVMKDIVIT